MTELVCKPTPGERIVKGRGLYSVFMNRVDLGLRIRAKNAGQADLMLQTCFQHELIGKMLDYDLEQFKKGTSDGNEGNEEGENEGSEEETGKEER